MLRATKAHHQPGHFPKRQRFTNAFIAALKAIVRLANDPRPDGVKKLVGSGGDWRVRIGEYRIVYEIDDSARTVTVLCVSHRRDAYR